MAIRFSQEPFWGVYIEAFSLARKHYEEIAHYKDIPLRPDEPRYRIMIEQNVLRTYVARDETGRLVGYQVFIVATSLHYMDSLQAYEDVLYVDSERRGFGQEFIRFADDELRKEGVQLVIRHVKRAHNHGPLLERFGYENVDLMYARRLDGE